MSAEELGTEDSIGDFLAPGDVLAGKYRVERLIGSGGMGVVVQAYHLHFEERVAIKFLLPQMGANEEALARFEREARAAFKIKSEHVTRVIDVGKLDDVPYMVMEYLEGTDLADLLTRRRALSVAETVEYIMQTCEAVAEAHALGIVHRDLKPENLFLTHRSDGTPCIKVLDFGLSKLPAGPGKQRERALTSASQPMGTPQYMSPEQWMSSSDVGPATDIWALGVLLYELVTGVQPFQREQLAQLCSMVLHTEPEPMRAHDPNVPAALEEVVSRCLHKDARERFANVAELALALYPLGEPRLRATAKRIAGIFRRIGVEVDEPPPSSTAPTRHGHAPPEATAHPPRQRYDSDTAVMPEPDDAATTWPSFPGHAPFPLAAPATDSSDRWPAAPTQPIPPQLHSGEHAMPIVRSVTAQSWLNSMAKERKDGRRAAIAVGIAAALVATAALVAVVGSEALHDAATSPAASGAVEAGASADAPDAPPASSAAPSSPPAAASASASAAPATASATASAGEPDPPKAVTAPVPNRRPPVVRSGPKPKPAPDIFGHR